MKPYYIYQLVDENGDLLLIPGIPRQFFCVEDVTAQRDELLQSGVTCSAEYTLQHWKPLEEPNE